jgi:hypothetical protein
MRLLHPLAELGIFCRYQCALQSQIGILPAQRLCQLRQLRDFFG